MLTAEEARNILNEDILLQLNNSITVASSKGLFNVNYNLYSTKEVLDKIVEYVKNLGYTTSYYSKGSCYILNLDWSNASGDFPSSSENIDSGTTTYSTLNSVDDFNDVPVETDDEEVDI